MFTYVGDDQQWRITWLSKHQVPLGALVTAVLAAGAVVWVRRRRSAARANVHA
jgi:hypothetical protein